MQTDVLIVGGGIVGMTAALDLAGAGRSVVIVDEGRHSGTTSNAGSLHVQMQSRFIRMYPDQVAGLERSVPLYPAGAQRWRELEAELGADMEIKSSGGLMVAENAEQFAFLVDKCARERRLGLDVHMLERGELSRVAPYLGEAVYGAELCIEEGKLNPLKANEAIRRKLDEIGVVRLDETVITRLDISNGKITAQTRGRGGVSSCTAGQVILASGSGTRQLAAMLNVAIPTTAEPLHVNVTEATTPLIGHLVQHAERMITMKQLGAGQVVIGGGWPARFTGPDEFPTVDPASMIGNLSLAQHIVPRLGSLRVIRTWAGVNTTADGQCILGALPGHGNVLAAVPGDAGYTLGPLVGRIAAMLAMGRDPGYDVERFTPARFGRLP
ncbi:MAG: NAD(P)/FAD-dependent oxidoreductase [Bosea sp. (in: a-proteobacteria)]